MIAEHLAEYGLMVRGVSDAACVDVVAEDTDDTPATDSTQPLIGRLENPWKQQRQSPVAQTLTAQTHVISG